MNSKPKYIVVVLNDNANAKEARDALFSIRKVNAVSAAYRTNIIDEVKARAEEEFHWRAGMGIGVKQSLDFKKAE